eukprot:353298-Chlamydomonas_euryale.AAC.5
MRVFVGGHRRQCGICGDWGKARSGILDKLCAHMVVLTVIRFMVQGSASMTLLVQGYQPRILSSLLTSTPLPTPNLSIQPAFHRLKA